MTEEPTARERLHRLIGYGCTEEVLDNLPLVLEAAREAGKAEPMNAVLPWSTLWRVPKAEPTPDEKP